MNCVKWSPELMKPSSSGGGVMNLMPSGLLICSLMSNKHGSNALPSASITLVYKLAAESEIK